MHTTDEIVPVSETHYAPFYKGYVARVHPGSIHGLFAQDESRRHNLFQKLQVWENLAGYAPGKWSIKEVLQHCIDTERIFTVRALMIARGESKAIPGYDQDDYTANSDADSRDLVSLHKEWSTVRQATLSLFESFQSGDFLKTGIANGNNLSVGAIPYIIVGHALHHFQVLQEKYRVEF